MGESSLQCATWGRGGLIQLLGSRLHNKAFHSTLVRSDKRMTEKSLVFFVKVYGGAKTRQGSTIAKRIAVHGTCRH